MDTSGDLVGVYIGESDNVSRRMENYRNPGPTQPTNQRMHARIREVLDAGGSTTLTVSLDAMIDEQALDLATRPARLLAENAALVHAERRGEPVKTCGRSSPEPALQTTAWPSRTSLAIERFSRVCCVEGPAQ